MVQYLSPSNQQISSPATKLDLIGGAGGGGRRPAPCLLPPPAPAPAARARPARRTRAGQGHVTPALAPSTCSTDCLAAPAWPPCRLCGASRGDKDRARVRWRQAGVARPGCQGRRPELNWLARGCPQRSSYLVRTHILDPACWLLLSADRCSLRSSFTLYRVSFIGRDFTVSI